MNTQIQGCGRGLRPAQAGALTVKLNENSRRAMKCVKYQSNALLSPNKIEFV